MLKFGSVVGFVPKKVFFWEIIPQLTLIKFPQEFWRGTHEQSRAAAQTPEQARPHSAGKHRSEGSTLNSHQVLSKSFCRSQLTHSSVNLSFTITNIKNKLTVFVEIDFCKTTLETLSVR